LRRATCHWRMWRPPPERWTGWPGIRGKRGTGWPTSAGARASTLRGEITGPPGLYIFIGYPPSRPRRPQPGQLLGNTTPGDSRKRQLPAIRRCSRYAAQSRPAEISRDPGIALIRKRSLVRVQDRPLQSLARRSLAVRREECRRVVAATTRDWPRPARARRAGATEARAAGRSRAGRAAGSSRVRSARRSRALLLARECRAR
jgi:hypothetical protein